MVKRRPTEEFSIAFLDVICCGFGAVILLLMITKTVQPQVLERVAVDSLGAIRNLQEQIFQMRGETTELNRELTSKQEQISELKQRIAILRGELESEKNESSSLRLAEAGQLEKAKQLELAMQRLTEEQKRLSAQQADIKNNVIGGIPVDSEWLVFVIDTSGSMTSNWSRVMREVTNAIKVYPMIKGVQVLNGAGTHMRPSTAGDFLPGEVFKSSTFIRQLDGFKNTFDRSNLTPGIKQAVKLYSRADRGVSIYIFADDISTNVSTQSVVNTIRQANTVESSGRKKTRIHFVGFPNLLEFLDNPMMRVFDIDDRVNSFSHFARTVAEQNDGAFIAISE